MAVRTVLPKEYHLNGKGRANNYDEELTDDFGTYCGGRGGFGLGNIFTIPLCSPGATKEGDAEELSPGIEILSFQSNSTTPSCPPLTAYTNGV